MFLTGWPAVKGRMGSNVPLSLSGQAAGLLQRVSGKGARQNISCPAENYIELRRVELSLMTSFLRLKQSASRKDYDRKGFLLILKEHFQKSFVKLSKIGAAVTAIEFHLSHNLGVIQFLTEAAVFVLNKAGSENYPL